MENLGSGQLCRIKSLPPKNLTAQKEKNESYTLGSVITPKARGEKYKIKMSVSESLLPLRSLSTMCHLFPVISRPEDTPLNQDHRLSQPASLSPPDLGALAVVRLEY